MPQAEKIIKTKWFRNYLVAEAGLCFLLVLILALTRPQSLVASIVLRLCGSFARSLSINKYLTVRAGRAWHPNAILAVRRTVSNGSPGPSAPWSKWPGPSGRYILFTAFYTPSKLSFSHIALLCLGLAAIYGSYANKLTKGVRMNFKNYLYL